MANTLAEKIWIWRELPLLGFPQIAKKQFPFTWRLRCNCKVELVMNRVYLAVIQMVNLVHLVTDHGHCGPNRTKMSVISRGLHNIISAGDWSVSVRLHKYYCLWCLSPTTWSKIGVTSITIAVTGRIALHRWYWSRLTLSKGHWLHWLPNRNQSAK